jgi:FlaA1/EpsC-like NDP-sugar epimerase
MVSITGYNIETFFFFTAASYLLLMMFVIARMMNDVLNEEREERMGILKSLMIGVVFLVVISVAYYFPVRIGFVMFVNGGFFTLTCLEVVRILGRWSPFEWGNKHGTENSN